MTYIDALAYLGQTRRFGDRFPCFHWLQLLRELFQTGQPGRAEHTGHVQEK